MGAKISPLTKYIARILALQRTPKTMKWIVDRVELCKSFKAVTHRQIWNACWNSCLYPTERPRFKVVHLKDQETAFVLNRDK